MIKRASKFRILKEKFTEFSNSEFISFREFIEQESVQPYFWPWFFDDGYTGELSSEQESKFQMFLKMIDQTVNRRKRIKEKDTHLHIKLSTSEKEKFQKKADKLGISLSSYIRKTVSGDKIVVKTDYEMIHQMRKIGVNINQIAHKINQESSEKNIISGLHSLEKYMESISKIIDKIEK